MGTQHRAGRRRTRQVAAAGTVGAALVGVVALQAASAGERDDTERGAGGATEQPAPEAVAGAGASPGAAGTQAAEDYWTEERMAAAAPTVAPAVDEAEVAAADAASNVLPREVVPGTVPDGAVGDAEGDRPLALPVAER